MYVPKHFLETDEEMLSLLIEENSFASLVTIDDGRPFCSHLPFLFEGTRLLCHLAKANPQVEHLKSGREVLAIFEGPHAYVSPSWYKSPGVPTWNYAVAHVYGKPVTIESEAELQALVDSLTAQHEADEAKPWKPDYETSMLQGIVGFEIAIDEIRGKFKMSQNRTPEDRANVADRLHAKGSDLGTATASYMRSLENRRSG